MTDIVAFLMGLGITLAITIAAVVYLRPHLRKILIDLCGTEERGDFWTAFSNVTIVLVPLICAMFSPPKTGTGTSLFFEISGQLKWARIGLVGAVVLMALVISRFMPRE